MLWECCVWPLEMLETGGVAGHSVFQDRSFEIL